MAYKRSISDSSLVRQSMICSAVATDKAHTRGGLAMCQNPQNALNCHTKECLYCSDSWDVIRDHGRSWILVYSRSVCRTPVLNTFHWCVCNAGIAFTMLKTILKRHCRILKPNLNELRLEFLIWAFRPFARGRLGPLALARSICCRFLACLLPGMVAFNAEGDFLIEFWLRRQLLASTDYLIHDFYYAELWWTLSRN